MAVSFWYSVKSDVSCVRYCICVHWTSHFLQGTINTKPCLNDHPVYSVLQENTPSTAEEAEPTKENRKLFNDKKKKMI